VAKESTKAKQKAQEKKAQKKQAEKNRGKQTWKLVGTGAAVVAGLATTKALDATWRTATGKKPPTKPENPDIANREALLWAGISGAAYGLTKTYFTRRAARYWVRSTGKLPPGMEEKASAKDKKKVKNAP
jgi:Protein of unknown function (DUF4235)